MFNSRPYKYQTRLTYFKDLKRLGVWDLDIDKVDSALIRDVVETIKTQSTRKRLFITARSIFKDLGKCQDLPHLDAEAIFANYTPVENQSPSMANKHHYRIDLINEILSVDEILISTPLWNWSIPSVLKAYIDQIVVTGVFDNGKPGLTGKKVTYVIAQGGSYKEGTPKAGWDFATGYLELVAKALGATDIETILAEFTLSGVAPGMDFLKDAKAKSLETALSAARKRAA